MTRVSAIRAPFLPKILSVFEVIRAKHQCIFCDWINLMPSSFLSSTAEFESTTIHTHRCICLNHKRHTPLCTLWILTLNAQMLVRTQELKSWEDARRLVFWKRKRGRTKACYKKGEEDAQRLVTRVERRTLRGLWQERRGGRTEACYKKREEDAQMYVWTALLQLSAYNRNYFRQSHKIYWDSRSASLHVWQTNQVTLLLVNWNTKIRAEP